jgi:serine/threonine protein kinase
MSSHSPDAEDPDTTDGRATAGQEAPPRPSLAPGELLEGKYRITRELGRGAMGVVYEALHTALGLRVAVKTLIGDSRTDRELAARFEREARAASAIAHPNVIDVFDLGRSKDGLLFMVMELLDGSPLDAILRRTPRLPLPLALDIMGQVLVGLAAAHKQKIVHRDLKPENIFVLDSEERPNLVKIVDFGISKILESQATPPSGMDQFAGTMMGSIIGSPLYMAPEQATGQIELIDHRTDIYAAGVVLYEMLCGRPPFRGKDRATLVAQLLAGECLAPRELRPELPPVVEAAILRAMSRDIEARFPSAAAMSAALGIPATTSTTAPPSTAAAVTRPSVAQFLKAGAAGGADADFQSAATVLAGLPTVSTASAPAPKRTRSTRTFLVVTAVALVAAAAAFAAYRPDLVRTLISKLTKAPAQNRQPTVARPAMSKLSLVTSPSGAEVYDGNTKHGLTPFSFSAAADSKTVAFTVSKPGYETEQVEFDPARDAFVSRMLRPATLSIASTPPVAEVYLDGALLCTTPCVLPRSREGELALLFKKTDFKDTTAVLAPDQTALSVALAPAAGPAPEDDPIPGLIAKLGQGSKLEAPAVAALLKIGRPAVPALINALAEPDGNRRQAAAEVLGKLKDASAIPALATRLQDASEDGEVLEAIKDALTKMGKPAVSELKNLLHEQNRRIQSQAASALALMGDHDAQHAFAKYFCEGSEEQQEQTYDTIKGTKVASVKNLTVLLCARNAQLRDDKVLEALDVIVSDKKNLSKLQNMSDQIDEAVALLNALTFDESHRRAVEAKISYLKETIAKLEADPGKE